MPLCAEPLIVPLWPDCDVPLVLPVPDPLEDVPLVLPVPDPLADVPLPEVPAPVPVVEPLPLVVPDVDP